MWRSKKSVGFIEIEADYARLLKNEDGINWQSLIVAGEGDIWTSLTKAIPSFFAKKTIIDFICSNDSGTLVFGLPSNLSDEEIEGNLQINRRSFFNESEELHFAIKKSEENKDTQKSDYIVSYIKKSLIENIKNLCDETKVKLGKISTLPDTLFGALNRQFKINDGVNICIQVRLRNVFVIIFRGDELISVRSFLTGNYRDLEKRLTDVYSLTPENAKLMVSGYHPEPNQAIQYAIKENRLQFITNLGGIFAELRTKRLLTNSSELYLAFDVVHEPQLTSMISERFDIKVNLVSGLENDEKYVDYQDYYATWLCGASNKIVPNLIPNKKISFRSIVFHPATIIFIAVLINLLPRALMSIQDRYTKNKLLKIRAEYKQNQIDELLRELDELSKTKEEYEANFKEIMPDIERSGIASRLAIEILDNLPELTRLDSMFVDIKSNRITLVGYTVDTETALVYLDNIKTCKEIEDAEISISDFESKRIKFVINGTISAKKG